MPYTVTYPGGTKDSEFQTYVRLLRQDGVDIGNLPRVPEPDTGRKWLYAWVDQEKADAFRERLAEETGDPAWQVVPVDTNPSHGPLGPVIFQLARTGDGFTFGLPPLSRIAIERVLPGARFLTSTVNVERANWEALSKTGTTFHDLVRMVIPTLTGLPAERLDALGYAVVDADAGETVDDVPAAGLPQPVPAVG